MVEVSELQVAIAALAQIEFSTELDAVWEASNKPDADSDAWEAFAARFKAIRMPAIIKDLEESHEQV